MNKNVTMVEIIKNIGIGLMIIAFTISCNKPTSESPTNDKPSKCIENVLSEDSILGKKRNHDCEQISLNQTIDNYVKALAKVNFDDCPVEFKEAYDKHIQAWKEMKKVTGEYSELRGEMHDLFDEIKEGKDSIQFKEYLAGIWDTWGEIEKIEK